MFLNDANYNTVMGKGKKTLIMFYAPWYERGAWNVSVLRGGAAVASGSREMSLSKSVHKCVCLLVTRCGHCKAFKV